MRVALLDGAGARVSRILDLRRRVDARDEAVADHRLEDELVEPGGLEHRDDVIAIVHAHPLADDGGVRTRSG